MITKMIYTRSCLGFFYFYSGIRKKGWSMVGEREQALVILSICETPELIIATSATAHEKKKLMLAFGKKKKFFWGLVELIYTEYFHFLKCQPFPVGGISLKVTYLPY